VPPGPALPWWRTTPAIVIGALLFLFVGGLGGVILTLAGQELAGNGRGGTSGDTSASAVTYGDRGDLATIDLAPGQCARPHVDDATTLDATTAVDCAAEHATEVYATAEVPTIGGDLAYPVNRDDLAAYADDACYLAFEPYVGATYDDSSFDYVAVLPSPQAWTAGERTVFCVLAPYDTDTTTGSANGSGD
jgi:hypothetical protein